MSRGSTLRLVRRGLLVGGGAASLYFLHRNDYDINSIGAMRLGRAGLVAGKIILDYKLHFVGADFRSEETRRLRSEVHQRSADKLLQLACDNGGVWIKVGQHLGALEYLLPSEYTRTLSKLHSDAPKSSFSDVCKVVKAEFGKEVSEIFSEFSESPIGAASLAQVHKAVLRSDGTTVAVKVQHPRVKPHSRVDCITMEVLVKVVARIFPEFKLLWLAEEMKKNLPVELNFELEGKAADRVRKTFAYLDFLKIPLVHWELTTDRVLTMEFVEGGKVNDLDFMREHKVDTNRVCRDIGRLYADMIFLDGYVHCDPHPGNVLVQLIPGTRRHKIVLLDHGLYTTLDPEFRYNYAQLWMSIISADLDGIKQWSQKLNVGDLYGLFACMITARSWQSITHGVANADRSSAENEEISLYISSLLPQISDVIDRVPRPMILLLKTNDLIRSIEHNLKTESASAGLLQMSAVCVTAIRDTRLPSLTHWHQRLALRLWALYHLTRLTLLATALRIYSAARLTA